MEVFLAINRPLQRLRSNAYDTGPVPQVKFCVPGVKFSYAWSVDVKPVVKLSGNKYSKKLADAIEKLDGLAALVLDVQCCFLENALPSDSSAVSYIWDRDGVLEKIVNMTGKEPTTGDIMYLYLERTMLFEGLKMAVPGVHEPITPLWVAETSQQYCTGRLCELIEGPIQDDTFAATIRLVFE